VKLSIALRHCILLLLRNQADDDLLLRVLHQAQALQLPLMLRLMTQSGESKSISHCVPLLDTAYRSLCSNHGGNLDNGTKSPCDSEVGMQQLRDVLAALNHALHLVPQPVSAVGSYGVISDPFDITGHFVAAASKMLMADDDNAAMHGSWLQLLICEMRESLDQAMTSIDATSAAAEIATASVATLSLLLESEKNARAAADIKGALLQRECQKLKDEIGRLLESAAASSSSSEAQLQLMVSEVSQLKVTFLNHAQKPSQNDCLAGCQ
jgi:hypothetical protein